MKVRYSLQIVSVTSSEVQIAEVLADTCKGLTELQYPKGVYFRIKIFQKMPGWKRIIMR